MLTYLLGVRLKTWYCHEQEQPVKISVLSNTNALPDGYNTTMNHTPAASTVLVVDDDERQRLMLSEMITSFGYPVEEAVDGQDALAKLEAAQFAVIVTDLVMPRMDGFQLLRTLLARDDLTPA